MAKSIEEQIEDWGKKQLGKTKYFTKTESINTEIETALKTAPSKTGGTGMNYPDIKLFIETSPILEQLFNGTIPNVPYGIVAV